jgi:hypothetical protein
MKGLVILTVKGNWKKRFEKNHTIQTVQKELDSWMGQSPYGEKELPTCLVYVL